MPRYMLLIKAVPEAETDIIPADSLEEMRIFNDQLRAAGILVAAEGFRATSVDGYRVKYSSTGPPEITKGPFDVEKEAHVCGWWIFKTKDAEEALDWAKKIPFKSGELVMRRITEEEELAELSGNAKKE